MKKPSTMKSCHGQELRKTHASIACIISYQQSSSRKMGRKKESAEFRPKRKEAEGPYVDIIRRRRGCGIFGAQEEDVAYVSASPIPSHFMR
jgi:hypothetical protein